MRTGAIEPVEAPLYDPRHEHDACGVGFVADLDGRHAPSIVPLALEALAALAHRGARAADDATGDGAGVSIPISARFRRRLVAEAGARVWPRQRVAVGMCFLPSSDPDAAAALVARAADALDLHVAGWREVPIEGSMTADRGIGGTPVIRQAIVVAERRMTALGFARALATMRRSAEAALSALAIASLSQSTLVYKGLFVGDEIGRYYPDLGAGDLDARYAVFHQRYSTNTFPSWRLAQPFGYLAHNGEINTVRANREAMRGRRQHLGRRRWMRRLVRAGDLVSSDGSDSQALDHALELLVLSGMCVQDAISTLIPGCRGARWPTRDASLPDRALGWAGGPCLRRWRPGRRHARPQWAAPASDGHHAGWAGGGLVGGGERRP